MGFLKSVDDTIVAMSIFILSIVIVWSAFTFCVSKQRHRNERKHFYILDF